MIYRLEELLTKMGAPEVKDKGRIEWHYFDKKKNRLAGFAEIRLEAGGEFLTAELKQLRENYEDDNGKLHDTYEEKFFLYAERTKPGHYRITQISFDGDAYGHPTKPIIELGLSVFHARALDISIRMIEHTFNKQDMLSADAGSSSSALARGFAAMEKAARSEYAGDESVAQKASVTGVVIPFRPRVQLQTA